MSDSILARDALRLLEEAYGFFRELDRDGIRLDEDFPEAHFQTVKEHLGDFLYPDAGPRPHERLTEEKTDDRPPEALNL